jgi:ankyrin repeat protein
MPTTQRRRSFLLFRRLKFSTSSSATQADEAQLDIDKMMLHCLDCLGALQCVMGNYDSARANVFWGAVQTIAEIGLDTNTGHMDMRHPGAMHLLRVFPNEQKATDGRGWLPLHWAAVTKGVDVKDVLKIARSDPMATTKGCYQPMSANPGHLICAERNPNMDVVRCLFNFYPRMASTKDNCGDLPIHYAARYTSSIEVIRYLLQSNPTSTRHRGEGDLVPLQCSFFNETSNRLAIKLCLLEADPGAAAITGTDGDTALHMAAVQECELKLMERLVDAFPDAAKVQNDIGLLPLHTACYSKKSLPIVQLLLRVYPEGAKVVSEAGMLPANIAAEYSSWEVLQEVLKAYPAAINMSCAEDLNNTPLMKAVISGNEECVRFICDEYPHTISKTNIHGRSAVHLAAEGDNVEILRMLDDSEPRLITTPDREGKLPLHLFADVHQEVIHENDREAECLRYLLRRFPEAARMTDNAGNTPLNLCNMENSFTRRMLLMADPTQGAAELRRHNYVARRMGVFLAFAAINADGIPNVFCNARSKDTQLLREILSYL